MNANDLPPAARLAALIEVGRATFPKVPRGRGAIYRDGSACALGFACLGAGMTLGDLCDMQAVQTSSAKVGIRLGLPQKLTCKVAYFNDNNARSLADVVASLREGELATITA